MLPRGLAAWVCLVKRKGAGGWVGCAVVIRVLGRAEAWGSLYLSIVQRVFDGRILAEVAG